MSLIIFSSMIIAQADTPYLFSKALELGVMAALVIFFVWQSSQRENKMLLRVSQLEDFQTTKLLEIIRDNHICLNRLTDAIEKIVK